MIASALRLLFAARRPHTSRSGTAGSRTVTTPAGREALRCGRGAPRPAGSVPRGRRELRGDGLIPVWVVPVGYAAPPGREPVTAPRRARAGIGAAMCLIYLLIPLSAHAQVYHWVDDQGTTHYSTGLESVPEPYRAQARSLPDPADRGQPEAVAPADEATRIPFTPGSPILVSAQINGLGPVTLILDTGADRTMVTPAALAQLGIPVPDGAIADLKGVTGSSRAPVVWVTSIAIGGAAAGPLWILAHDAALREADGLLGRDFLALFSVTIDVDSNVVTLRRP
jgi:aspartyl protease/uncharacterized protein DUF4124